MKVFANLKLMTLSVVLFCLSASVTRAQDNIIDEVIWVVGDAAILKSEVEEYRLQMLFTGERLKGDPYCVIPELLAVNKLYLHQAALDSIEVTDSEVFQRVEMRMNQFIDNYGSREKMEEYYNKTTSQIREFLRTQEKEHLTIQRMQQKLAGEVKVTPSEVRRYFRDLPEDSIPYIPTQVEIQIITQEPRIPIEEIEDVKTRLREFTERINSGEMKFSTLARLYSEDRSSAVRGGETGFMGRGNMVPEYANVAFNLQDPTKISKVVESEYGFHIIQLIEKRGDRINTRHILLKPKVPDTELIASMGRLDSIANDIRSEKFSFEDAAIMLSHDKDTRNNRGLMPNPYTNTSRFEMQQLPQEIGRIVDNMNVGEISKAFTMVSVKDGKEVCAVVKLKSRIDGHKATISEDYQRLKDIVIARKQDELLEKWVGEKLKQTYVRINERWKNCDFKYQGWIKD